jgi:hypothetical protein
MGRIVIQNIDISAIRADAQTQPRAAILTDKIAEYTEPLVVFYDGLGDGFHRHEAAICMGFANFPCDVREGGLREAVLLSCGANAAHAIQRSNADKRNAVLKLLNDEAWSGWSDSEIARRCAVTHQFVGKLRASIPATVAGMPASEDVVQPDVRTFTHPKTIKADHDERRQHGQAPVRACGIGVCAARAHRGRRFRSRADIKVDASRQRRPAHASLRRAPDPGHPRHRRDRPWSRSA